MIILIVVGENSGRSISHAGHSNCGGHSTLMVRHCEIERLDIKADLFRMPGLVPAQMAG